MKERLQKYSLKRGAWKLLLVLAGNTLYALGVALFLLPAGLITGGTTGLGLVAEHFFHVPLTAFVAVFNLAMFLVGLLVLGKVFALTTIISSFYYPFILEVIQRTIGEVRKRWNTGERHGLMCATPSLPRKGLMSVSTTAAMSGRDLTSCLLSMREPLSGRWRRKASAPRKASSTAG